MKAKCCLGSSEIRFEVRRFKSKFADRELILELFRHLCPRSNLVTLAINNSIYGCWFYIWELFIVSYDFFEQYARLCNHSMPSKKTVDRWGFSCLGYDVDDNGEVCLIWCKTCREFFESQANNVAQAKGIAATVSETFIKGTAKIKKNNFSDHVKKSQTHATAVLRLTEANNTNSTSATAAPPQVPRQRTLVPYLQKISARQRLQLTSKFQLAHFLVGKNKSFKFYEDMTMFEDRVHHVDLGKSYTSNKAAKEIVSYISKSIVLTEITEPLNNNTVNYYSVLNDGSSSAKTMDEKEIFLIKTGANGTPKFEVMSLEEPESCDAEGLQKSLTAATGKMNFSFSRADKELGMCSDGAAVNVKLHRLVQEELGPHYILVLCPSHKVELAIKDAFTLSELNRQCQEDISNVYYLSMSIIHWVKDNNYH